ncbi:MAG: F-type H+-transporting ATPase subunit gamma [Candidatus Omnitrophota bacterium]|jgi:F-type H+-transporting ATPase subunit gamma
MASLRELRRRIKSVENIQGITKAMELISAVRFKKIDVRNKKALPYYKVLERLISNVVSEDLVSQIPLFEKREIKKELLIVVTGDRGLCGGFNSSVTKRLSAYITESKHEVVLYPIGKVGYKFVKKREWPIHDSWVGLGYAFTPDSLSAKRDEIINLFLSGEYDSIRWVTSSMERVGVQIVKFEKFLDMSYLMDLNAEADDANNTEYIFEPNPLEVLQTLIEIFIKQRFFVLLLSSVTAEYFARMVAMKQATDNGRDVIDSLTLQRNKVRQAMITREISEIIGGVNALS